MSEEQTIYVKRYSPEESDERFAVNDREIWRYSGYMGIPGSEQELLKDQLEQMKKEVRNVFQYKVCYRRIPITWEDGRPILPFYCESANLADCLAGASEVIMFAATIGMELDRHIARAQRLSPTKALLMQAYGAERVECLCDAFCDEIEVEICEEGLFCTPRYSPGYGDLPLTAQKDFFRILDCSRQVGISLNESLLMSPSKSVTAIFGIGQELSRVHHGTYGSKCNKCGKTDCSFRRI